MQDFEFTIEDENFYAPNPKEAQLVCGSIATEMVKEKLIDWKTAIKRVPAEQLDQVLAPVFDAVARGKRTNFAKAYLQVQVQLPEKSV